MITVAPFFDSRCRSVISEDVLENIVVWIEKHSIKDAILSGGLNAELDDSIDYVVFRLWLEILLRPTHWVDAIICSQVHTTVYLL